MPGTPATRNEAAVLHTDALPEDALDGGAAAGLSSPGKRVHIRGMSSVRPAAKPDTWLTDTLLTGLQKSLDLSRDTFKRYGTEAGRREDALAKSFQDAVEAMVLAQGKALVEKAPFGKVILVSVELSQAFAEGVGAALIQVNSELADKYDFSKISDRMDEEDVARTRAMRGYQAESTRQLARVVAEGLARVAETALDMVLAKIGEIPKKVLGDVAGQIAGQAVRQNDLLAVLREAVEESGKSIPAGRAKVERMLFHFVSSAWLSQFEDKELQQRLAKLPEVAKSDKPVDVALLASIISILAEGSYDTYTRHVQVGYVQSEAKGLLVQVARGLAGGLVGVELAPSRSGTVEVEAKRIGVPATWLPSLVEPAAPAAVLRERWWSREKELLDYLRRLRLALDVRRRSYEHQWQSVAAEGDPAVWAALQNRWVADWQRSQRDARAAVEAIVEEFGEAWASGTARAQLLLDIDIHLGREREVPAFAARPW